MKRFLRNLLILDVLIAAGMGVWGWQAGWTASRFTLMLTLVTGILFFFGGASFGGTGPASHLSGASISGPNVFEAVAQGEEIRRAYGNEPGTTKGDYYGRWRARHGWNPGSHRAAWLMLAAGASTSIATLVSWKVFE